MRLGALSAFVLHLASLAVAVPLETDITRAQEWVAHLADLALQASKREVANNGLSTDSEKGTCSWDKIIVRREWGNLSKKERRSYIDAVKCLQAAPARTPAEEAPGAKSRFDDYVANHINETNYIHFTGNFLVWHRYYVWLYERALREECGYDGSQPYWDWSKTAITGLHKSPIFDGSDTSMSGDGYFIPNRSNLILGKSTGLPPLELPVGTGGGCVKSGPFKDMSVNLGPAALDSYGGEVIKNPDGPLAYNPRCLKRDLTDFINRRFSNASSVLSSIVKPRIIWDFEIQMQGLPGSGTFGIHGGGHYSLGGDPGRDPFVSPGDPVFFLHHSMIDRVWWMWQMMDPETRQYSDDAISGTNTQLNTPPSRNTTLDDYVEYGFADGPPRKIRDLMSTVGGPFCYIYR